MGKNYGKLVQFTNREGRTRTAIVLDSALAGDGKDGLMPLIDMGFQPKRDRASLDAVKDYLYHSKPDTTAICVSRIGWDQGRVFVLPGQCFGPLDGEQVLFPNADTIDHKYRQAGTLADWQTNIGRYCEGNSRLSFLRICRICWPAA
jgi:putative DNA primase/helicase